MTPEQWVTAESLFECGLGLPEPEREALLDGVDEEIAAELRKLWQHAASIGTFLADPIVAIDQVEEPRPAELPVFSAGQVFGGRFTVVDFIGRGGMGELYRARDERLGRIVAVKVLPARLVEQTGYRDYLEREARSLSALNHPRICSLHDVGLEGDSLYLVMEYLSGESLAERISHGPLNTPELLRIATQMAEGLEYSHAQGIIHRDLKPANIMLTPGGAKLLDFGIAKRTFEAAAAAASGPGQGSQTATVTGTMFGTLAYMSPEQAEGGEVDERSDIFSFGCVLYEMATGHQAFSGAAPISTLAAILHHEPTPLRSLAPASPPALDSLIRHCLAKKREDRYQSMKELRAELDVVAPDPTASPRLGRRITLALSAGSLLVIAIGAWWVERSIPTQPGFAAGVRLTFSGVNDHPCISKDGRLVAYDSWQNGNSDLYIRNLETKEVARLTNTPYNEVWPSFTPDGKQIVFASDEPGAAISVIPASGGPVRHLAAAGVGPLAVSPDGKQIAYLKGVNDNDYASEPVLRVVATSGGPFRELPIGLFAAGFPAWTPDGGHLMLIGCRKEALVLDLWVVPSNGSSCKRLDVPVALRRLGAKSSVYEGPLLFYRGAWYFTAMVDNSYTLVEVRFDPAKPDRSTVLRGLANTVDFHRLTSLTSSGLATMVRATDNRDLYRLRINPRTNRVIGQAERLTADPTAEYIGSISGDGRWLAYASNRDGDFAFYVRDLRSGTDRRLGRASVPVSGYLGISPDGRHIVYPSPDRSKLMLASTADATSRFLVERSRGVEFAGWIGSTKVMVAAQVKEAGGLVSNVFEVLDVSDGSSKVVKRKVPERGDTENCLPVSAGLESCVEGPPGEQRAIVRRIGAPRNEAFELREAGNSGRIWACNGSAVYWFGNQGGHQALLALRLDPQTGKPLTKPIVSYVFRDRVTVPQMDILPWFDGENLVLHDSTKTSDIWIQQMPR